MIPEDVKESQKLYLPIILELSYMKYELKPDSIPRLREKRTGKIPVGIEEILARHPDVILVVGCHQYCPFRTFTCTSNRYKR